MQFVVGVEKQETRSDRPYDKEKTGRKEIQGSPLILSSPEDKKPDIVAYDKENHRVLVWDPTVDLTDLDEAEANKCRKYDVEDVKKWLNEKFPRKSLKYGKYE